VVGGSDLNTVAVKDSPFKRQGSGGIQEAIDVGVYPLLCKRNKVLVADVFKNCCEAGVSVIKTEFEAGGVV
jgi:hypothetical protein